MIIYVDRDDSKHIKFRVLILLLGYLWTSAKNAAESVTLCVIYTKT